ncbi:RNA polymerase sigma factor [Kibdelosporangium aridum]|uniref:RNA polymerase sigma factor, sigma-70 family n=1 Tax=Kibdelosporangium aridum TaxID=2030 RepID=A0A1Y5Y1Y5_KIBAR|nr:sigma-70 family RNA polymerase sigma factor [Kibdelosporangium aridum]SMD24079.1 RNA polymerase sigma factor, sigma-70 family [Kibdelosporangium aridum]
MNTLLRELAPQVLGALVRKFGDFDTCEDAVQEALLAASVQWPEQGMPDNPKSWLITVASRRRIELLRSDTARQRREETVAALVPADPALVPDVDDTLTLFLLCCHPSLTEASQVALTLRAVGGLTTAEIARAYLVPEATVAQRISRAKQKIKSAGSSFHVAGDVETVLKVLYLIFNEGYTASSGESLHRVELSSEAIRLTRQLRAQLHDHGEVTGLLALMLLTDARRPARTRADGALVPLAEQDRALWNAEAIDEGVSLISSTLSTAELGPYQIQAAIAAVHAEARKVEDTDWPQILALYDVLDRLAPGPMVTLNRIVAVAMVHGPAVALQQLSTAAQDPALADHHRVHAVRAHLLDLAGDADTARTEYELAARRTLSLPEQRYLRSRAEALA